MATPTPKGGSARTGGWKYQVGHVFRRGQPVYLLAEGQYALATLDTGFDGVVGDVAVNQFELVTNGELDGLTNLTVGQVYSLGAAPGALYPTTEAPVYKALSTTDVSLLSANAGSTSGDASLGVADRSITNTKLAQMPASTLKGNDDPNVADAQDLTVAQVKDLLNYDYADIDGLANIAHTGNADDLDAGTVPDARMPDLTGDVTTVEGTVATTIVANAVTNPKLATMPATTLKGNDSLATADPQDLTVPEVHNLLGVSMGRIIAAAHCVHLR